MSAYPPQGSYQSIDYNAGAFVPNPRPASVTVISIFAIILGSLGLFCGAIGLVMQALMAAAGGRNPFMPNLPIMNDKGLLVFQFVNSGVDLLIAGVLLAAGIGGLKLRPLARRVMLKLSVFTLVWATVTTVAQVVWVGPKTLAYSHQLQAQMGRPAPAAMPAGFETGMQVAGAIVGWVLWCALPVCTLIFWRSARVIAAFEQPQPPIATAIDPNWPQPPSPPPGS